MSHDYYQNLRLNASTKTAEGFDESLLEHILNLLALSIEAYVTPKLCHIVVQAPTDKCFERLGLEISRWFSQRKPNNHVAPLWIAVYEHDSRKGYHLHIALIADNISYLDVLLLAERLSKYSSKGYSKVQKRKRPYAVDVNGEIMKTNDGGLKRLGHTHFHNLITEAADAFERISYLAKNGTKRIIPSRKKHYLVCRYYKALKI